MVAKTNEGGLRPSYLYELETQLADIGIDLDVIIQDWPTFVGELISYHNFDLCYVAITSNAKDIDMRGVYNQDGSLNLFGYDTTMDYSATYGTGINEWYLQQGVLINPPDSGYNMREVRPIIGSRDPCPGDSSLTIGLAVRKAISYGMDRVEIDANVNNNTYSIYDYPFSPGLSWWQNPSIIQYTHNLTKAIEYMELAGFGLPTTIQRRRLHQLHRPRQPLPLLQPHQHLQQILQ
ncbi:MAG: hypothetical protein ACTSXA_01260 [Candidatus Heimdallarchaeota archaeon]